MIKGYTAERNAQMLIFLMKAHGVRKVIASPGSTNITVVRSLQQDPWFEIYSSVDERSAAYIACGMAAESGEPVALSCTGATASRNYVPGLTEAFYRKLPVLAITSTPHFGRVGQNIPQMTDRSRPMPDIARCSVQIPTIHNADDEWASNVLINKALLGLRRHGGGPVHIDLVTHWNPDFSLEKLPDYRVIYRIDNTGSRPPLPKGRIAIFVGAHKPWDGELIQLVDRFCERYNAVVLCDHTSNYQGKYGVYPNILTDQKAVYSPLEQVDLMRHIDLMIHLGDVSGAYMSVFPKEVWRVHPDGEIRDTFRTLTYVFEMEEAAFFRDCDAPGAGAPDTPDTSYCEAWRAETSRLREKIPELPFSNPWIAQQTISRLPKNCRLHLGILNSLRSWNYFERDSSILGFCNTGGFGIDGCVSSLLGASLASPEKLFFGVIGDLAFFYDLNAIGNRHVGPNLRILLINNGKGVEFRKYDHRANQLGDEADKYIAAGGHYGNKSPALVRHYAQDLGFLYLSAASKEEYRKHLEVFTSPERLDKPILLEAFTDSELESEALRVICQLEVPQKDFVVKAAKSTVKNILGEKGTAALRKIIRP